MARGRRTAHSGLRIEHEIGDGRERGVERGLGEPIQAGERGRGLERLDGEGAYRVSELRHARRSLYALSDHVADDEGQLAVRERDRVEPVAADVEMRRPGQIPGRQLHAVHARQRDGQDAALERLGDGLLGLEVPCAVERLSSLGRQDLDERAVVAREPLGVPPGGQEQRVRSSRSDQRNEEERLGARPRELVGDRREPFCGQLRRLERQ